MSPNGISRSKGQSCVQGGLWFPYLAQICSLALVSSDLWKANQPTSSSPMFVASTNWTPVSVITHLSYCKNVSNTQACRSDLVLTFLCSLSKIRSFSGVTHSHCGHTAEREGLAISAQIKTSLKVAALLVPESPPPPGWARAVTDFIQLVFSLAQPCS